MMGISEFFDFIYENNIDLLLVGGVELKDSEIKWMYDALGDEYEDVEMHLAVICEDDLETLEEFIGDHNLEDYITFLPPEFDDTIVTFLIVEE